MGTRFPWVVALLGLLVAGGYLFLRHNGAVVGNLTTGEFSSLAINVALAVFVGAMMLTLFRERLSKAILMGLLWTAIALVLLIGYAYRLELREAGDRVLAELIPGWAATSGRTVEVVRGRAGDFSVNARINGARVAMVLDSGASAVVLTQEAAKAAGLPLEVLNYSVSVDTANGRTRAAPVTLDRLAIGEVVERSVPALIAQPGQLKTSLLGMSFLNRLESWEVRGEKLLMRAYP
jgi:aspartyl protease family protein